LDFSEAEQRQLRELLQLLSAPDTVDDLGIGTVRDAISNQLFPGTSVIQTRARYFLFIPWIFQRAEERNPRQLVKTAEGMERRLILALQASDDLEGLIGRQAGANVRTLPSAIYWTGLAAYGIFLRPGLTRAQYGKAALRGRATLDPEDELNDRSSGFWHRDVPPPPDGFFDFTHADFQMTRDEASWLSERILSTEPLRGANLLGVYVRALRAGAELPDGMFWDAALPAETPAQLVELVEHAKQLSLAVEGAAQLYNLMLAQELEAAGSGDPEIREARLAGLAEWASEAEVAGLSAWAADLGPFWASLSRASSIPARSRAFVDAWCALLARDDLDHLPTDPVARELIRTRELEHKRAQARFGNPTRLKAWNGESGLGRLSFRWGQVQRFLSDLAAGLDPDVVPDTEVGVAAD
jgi:hypothetical protein